MTPSELKFEVTLTGSYYFSRSSMAFFGDTMKNYGVRSVNINTLYDDNDKYVGSDGIVVEAWELYRKRPVKMGTTKSHYFRKSNFEFVTGDVV